MKIGYARVNTTRTEIATQPIVRRLHCLSLTTMLLRNFTACSRSSLWGKSLVTEM